MRFWYSRGLHNRKICIWFCRHCLNAFGLNVQSALIFASKAFFYARLRSLPKITVKCIDGQEVALSSRRSSSIECDRAACDRLWFTLAVVWRINIRLSVFDHFNDSLSDNSSELTVFISSSCRHKPACSWCFVERASCRLCCHDFFL